MTYFLIMLINVACLLTVSWSMLAMANLLRWKKGWRWQVHFVGLTLAGVFPFGIIAMDIAFGTIPSIYELGFRVGLAFVFLPPLHKYITQGKYE